MTTRKTRKAILNLDKTCQKFVENFSIGRHLSSLPVFVLTQEDLQDF